MTGGLFKWVKTTTFKPERVKYAWLPPGYVTTKKFKGPMVMYCGKAVLKQMKRWVMYMDWKKDRGFLGDWYTQW
ncbi:hypothetical protein CCP3SC15_380019 [Gammaproteobacteria bacterium]